MLKLKTRKPLNIYEIYSFENDFISKKTKHKKGIPVTKVNTASPSLNKFLVIKKKPNSIDRIPKDFNETLILLLKNLKIELKKNICPIKEKSRKYNNIFS